MSFLGRNGGGNTGSGINVEKIDMATMEIDTITDFFNRMILTCHSKCIGTRYTEADLNKGEGLCIDRCVAKFAEVQKKTGEILHNKGAANAGGTGGFKM